MGVSRWSRVAVPLGAIVLSLGASAPGTAQPAGGNGQKCAAMAGRAFGDDVKITSAAHVEAAGALPAHCRVEGVIDERKGAGGKT